MSGIVLWFILPLMLMALPIAIGVNRANRHDHEADIKRHRDAMRNLHDFDHQIAKTIGNRKIGEKGRHEYPGRSPRDRS